MIKQLIIVLLCLFAIAHGRYIVQRIFHKEDTNCDSPTILGSFFEDTKCYSTGRTIQRTTCNTTHVNIDFECNLECTRCGRSISYPRDKCITGFINVHFSCPETLPTLKDKGIYLRSFTNSKCNNYPPGDHGFFLTDELCNSNSPQKEVFGLLNSGTSPSSQKGYFDRTENVYKLEDYEKENCKGRMIKSNKFPVDKCMKVPEPNFKTIQPATHAILSKK
eukprot:gene489-8003_t